MKTNYSLWRPSLDEIKEAFGSFGRALSVTGGDIPVLCFYINNPESIPVVPPGREVQRCSIFPELRDAAVQEACVKAWNDQPEKPRRTVAEVMRRTGYGRVTCTAALDRAGLRAAVR